MRHGSEHANWADVSTLQDGQRGLVVRHYGEAGQMIKHEQIVPTLPQPRSAPLRREAGDDGCKRGDLHASQPGDQLGPRRGTGRQASRRAGVPSSRDTRRATRTARADTSRVLSGLPSLRGARDNAAMAVIRVRGSRSGPTTRTKKERTRHGGSRPTERNAPKSAEAFTAIG